MKNKKNRIKNHYILILGICVLIGCAIFSAISVFNKVEKDDVNKSPLATNEILYTDIKNALKEINADTFLVISYTGDIQVHKNEKEIEKYLKNINLLDNVMYLHMKEYVNDALYLDNLNKVLKLKGNSEIHSLPAVVFYKNGVVEYVRNSKKGCLEKNAFKNYIDQNGLAS